MTLKIYFRIHSCYMASYLTLESPKIHDMRMVCLLKAVAPGWLTNTVSFILGIDYPRYGGLFLRYYKPWSIVFYRSSPRVDPACPKRTLLRDWPNEVFFVYVT